MKFSILFFAVLFFGLPNCFLSQHTIIPSPSNVNLTGGVLYMEKDITVNAQNLPGVIKEHLLRIWTKEIGKNIVFVKDQADIVFHEGFFFN